ALPANHGEGVRQATGHQTCKTLSAHLEQQTKRRVSRMKKSLMMTLLALVAITMFSFGCKKEETVSTDTATTDTAMSSTTATSSTDTTGSMTSTSAMPSGSATDTSST